MIYYSHRLTSKLNQFRVNGWKNPPSIRKLKLSWLLAWIKIEMFLLRSPVIQSRRDNLCELKIKSRKNFSSRKMFQAGLAPDWTQYGFQCSNWKPYFIRRNSAFSIMNIWFLSFFIGKYSNSQIFFWLNQSSIHSSKSTRNTWKFSFPRCSARSGNHILEFNGFLVLEMHSTKIMFPIFSWNMFSLSIENQQLYVDRTRIWSLEEQIYS